MDGFRSIELNLSILKFVINNFNQSSSLKFIILKWIDCGDNDEEKDEMMGLIDEYIVRNKDNNKFKMINEMKIINLKSSLQKSKEKYLLMK